MQPMRGETNQNPSMQPVRMQTNQHLLIQPTRRKTNQHLSQPARAQTDQTVTSCISSGFSWSHPVPKATQFARCTHWCSEWLSAICQGMAGTRQELAGTEVRASISRHESIFQAAHNYMQVHQVEISAIACYKKFVQEAATPPRERVQ
mmetsp:Transcript_34320/g.77837  ORF Transcript_34320/g.77837 Transcript_34320/m.77837 type:complete len:148 (-) Transcript_34320:203-646(-)